MTFKAMKFRVKDEEHSKEIQEALFKLGYKWFPGHTSPLHTDAGYIYTDAGGHISKSYKKGQYDTFFEDQPEKEYTVEDLQQMLRVQCPYEVAEEEQPHSHYFKDVSHLVKMDIYRFIDLFEITDPCLQHIVKKAACAGKRGAKDFEQDVKEIFDTAKRKLEMLKEDEKCGGFGTS